MQTKNPGNMAWAEMLEWARQNRAKNSNLERGREEHDVFVQQLTQDRVKEEAQWRKKAWRACLLDPPGGWMKLSLHERLKRFGNQLLKNQNHIRSREDARTNRSARQWI